MYRTFECPATLYRVVEQSGSGTAPGAHQISEESSEVTTYGLRKAALRSRHAFPRSSLPAAALFSLPFQKGREKRGVGFSPMPAGIGIPVPRPVGAQNLSRERKKVRAAARPAKTGLWDKDMSSSGQSVLP